MDFLNKTYKNRLTGESFSIVDQYQNVAITSNKEKINTSLLQNANLFIEVSNSPSKSINESVSSKSEEFVDPNKFFNSQKTYDAFAQTIKSVDLSKIKDDSSGGIMNNTGNINLPVDYQTSPMTNESAIIMSDPEDEIEELKRKYGATSIDDSVKRQNDAFNRILDPQSETVVENNTPNINMNMNNNFTPEPPIQRIDAMPDPVFNMFRNVKRNLDFKINLKIDGKIPRLDFIEMMEDSYEVSIIEYLAEEFTNNILNNPALIKEKVMSEIKNMIEKSKGKSTQTNSQITDSVTTELPKEEKVETKTSKPRSRTTTKKKAESQ